ncbi:MAG: hypothetical protein JJE47_11410 [Acidimicrobiia bacterium]|nr:hypothetical protein [Acidimicrobiia bacterium]
MSGFMGGFIVAIAGAAVALGVVALVGVFHKAINVYRGAGLLTVLALMAAVVWFAYGLVADPNISSDPYLGSFLGLGGASFALLTKARHFVPTAMLPPPPPPTLGTVERDAPPTSGDPFARREVDPNG